MILINITQLLSTHNTILFSLLLYSGIPVFILSNGSPNMELCIKCGRLYLSIFLLLGFLFVPKFLFERKQTKETQHFSGEKVICQKTRKELIAEVAELRAFIHFESRGSETSMCITEKLGLSKRKTNEEQKQRDAR